MAGGLALLKKKKARVWDQLCEASHVSHIHKLIFAKYLEVGSAVKCAACVFVALVLLGTTNDSSLLI